MLIAGERIDARVIHRGRDRHRSRDEVLHLARAHVVLLQVAGERGWDSTLHRVDDLRVYDRVFELREQCEQVLGGRYCDGLCVLP